jgi:hypothetical protein
VDDGAHKWTHCPPESPLRAPGFLVARFVKQWCERAHSQAVAFKMIEMSVKG